MYLLRFEKLQFIFINLCANRDGTVCCETANASDRHERKVYGYYYDYDCQRDENVENPELRFDETTPAGRVAFPCREIEENRK